MSRHRTAPSIVAYLLMTLALLPPAALAESWQENIGLLVRVDGKPDGTARLFDSEDYQRMLLVIGDRPTALILELADGTIGGVPRDSVRVDPEGFALLGLIGSEYLTDCARKDGVITFALEEAKIEIAPIPPLIGETTLERLIGLKPAYALIAKAYEPNGEAVGAIKAVTEQSEVRVYFGTWCHLCKKIVPDLMRTVELAANPSIQVRYMGVDENLTQPEAEIRADRISKTPTIVVRRGGREIGRIEERASKSVEADLAGILAQR